ncbi:MAG: single-stranded-DNA-specific exonuclease RecJ [Alphaproteobacteria bacterium]|nr:single-stranded-DNA-specific exonuclease RecJ [Alphaproteobacteria bacterium]
MATELVPPAPVLGVARSLSGRRWLWRPQPAHGHAPLSGEAVAQRLGVPELVGRLLAARGVGMEAAADFLAPTLRALLPDPSLLADMEAAADRLAAAVRGGETVGVFGDYDVDGACSTALLLNFLRGLGCPAIGYIPDRLQEGYGPNGPALVELVAQGASLIVCVDCGTAAAPAFAVLRGRAEVVVLDHHGTDAALPGHPAPVLATVNPKRADDGSGLTHLCAAAIAFLAAVATVRSLRRGGWFAGRPEPDLFALLDLVALATICDVMPLTGANRALVAQGLKVMARRSRPGIAALLEVTQAPLDHATSVTCGYILGPRINAGGRIGEADLGLRLLMSADATEARALAGMLDAVNRQRQAIESRMLEHALAAAEAQAAAGRAVLLVSAPQWHPGVAGIVAGRIKERFNRPALVAAIADEVAKGSGRSVPGLDLGAAVLAARAAGLLATGGGHPMAAGFTLPVRGLDAFHAFLEARLAAAAALPGAADLLVEGALAVPGADLALAQQVMRLAPFGPGNEEPVFVLPRVRVVRADRVGRDAGAIRAYIEGEGGGARLKAMLFRAGDGPLAAALLSREGVALHLAGHLRADTWNGEPGACFALADAAPA